MHDLHKDREISVAMSYYTNKEGKRGTPRTKAAAEIVSKMVIMYVKIFILKLLLF